LAFYKFANCSTSDRLWVWERLSMQWMILNDRHIGI